MSIINDALKRAQNERTGSAMDAPPMPGGGSGYRGNQGMPKGLLMLLIAGAAVVIVLSVVATVYFVNRTPATSAIAATPVSLTATTPAVIAVPAAPGSENASSAVVTAPIIAPTPAPVVETPTQPTPVIASDPAVPATPVGVEPVVEGSLEDRIAAYVDKARVTGIRTSENISKVLMNDKVYRLNDVVDRKLGLRLVKIAPDSLTFADANGATYVKNF